MRALIIFFLLAIAQPGHAEQSCNQQLDERFELQFQTDAGLQGDIADLQQQINGLTDTIQELQKRLNTKVIRRNLKSDAPKERLSGGHHKRKHRGTRARRVQAETGGSDSRKDGWQLPWQGN